MTDCDNAAAGEESTQDALAEMKNRILKEADRLKLDDCFKFECRPGIACFNKCCGDVNIFLSPYDVLRLKNQLGMSSGDFLDKHTQMALERWAQSQLIMSEDVGEAMSAFLEKRPPDFRAQ